MRISDKSADEPSVRFACVGEKFSDRGFFFNERVLYADVNDVRYYSKVTSVMTSGSDGVSD